MNNSTCSNISAQYLFLKNAKWIVTERSHGLFQDINKNEPLRCNHHTNLTRIAYFLFDFISVLFNIKYTDI